MTKLIDRKRLKIKTIIQGLVPFQIRGNDNILDIYVQSIIEIDKIPIIISDPGDEVEYLVNDKRLKIKTLIKDFSTFENMDNEKVIDVYVQSIMDILEDKIKTK